MHRFSVLVIGAAMTMMLGGCLPEEAQSQPPSNRQVQNQEAARAAAAVTFTRNAEIENIQRRLRLTADPNLVGYIVLLNDAGQPIMYEGVMGKVTTSGSRLTSPDNVVRSTRGENGLSQIVTRAPSDTGTYDTGSTQFIFYWNTNGEYRQWSGQYLYSDKPIRLRVEPLVVSLPPQTPVSTPASK